MISVEDLKQIVDQWPTQNANGQPTCVFVGIGYPELGLPPEPVSCCGRLSLNDASLVFLPSDRAIPSKSDNRSTGVIELALAAIKAHCRKDKSATALTIRSVPVLMNAIKLENAAHTSPVTSSNLSDIIAELDQISSQAESVSLAIRAQDLSPELFEQLETITCRLETAASFIRPSISVT